MKGFAARLRGVRRRSCELPAVSIELELERCRSALNVWLLEAYAGAPSDGEFGRPYFGERDIGYEGWPAIYRVVGQVFTERRWSSLPVQRQRDIVFFIARENEGGAIISWLNSAVGGPLSNVGDLSPDDFASICRTCLELDEDCSDYVLASKLATFRAPRAEHVALLERFFCERTHTYTRRRALMSLEALGAPGVFEKAEALFWAPNADQWDRALCLSFMSKLAGQENDFAYWLSRAQALDAPSRSLIDRFRIARVEGGFGEN